MKPAYYDTMVERLKADIKRADEEHEQLVFVSKNTAKEILNVLDAKPIKPLRIKPFGITHVGNCICCGESLIAAFNPCYCGKCGQAVKWE